MLRKKFYFHLELTPDMQNRYRPMEKFSRHYLPTAHDALFSVLIMNNKLPFSWRFIEYSLFLSWRIWDLHSPSELSRGLVRACLAGVWPPVCLAVVYVSVY